MYFPHGAVGWSAVCVSYIALTFLFVSIICGSSSRRRGLVCSVLSYIALTFLFVSTIFGSFSRCRGLVSSVGFIYCFNFPVCVKYVALTHGAVGWSAVSDSYIALTFLFVSIICGSFSWRRVLVCSV